jgi:hypothetical protein
MKNHGTCLLSLIWVSLTEIPSLFRRQGPSSVYAIKQTRAGIIRKSILFLLGKEVIFQKENIQI